MSRLIKQTKEIKVQTCFTMDDCTIDDSCANCAFFKSPGQQLAERKRDFARLRSLDEFQQQHIADKYFKGVKVWDR